MIVMITLLSISILLGIAGSIILVLGLNNKKVAMIVSGGILLLFTVLFCAGSVFCSLRGPMDRNFMPNEAMMRPPMCPPMPPMHKCCECNPVMDGHCRHEKDSICAKVDVKK
ncbi:MAG: hypothetical protein Q8880_08265 [Bacteroidota bacterium]|nr:hypothetical protein [Bacteroidota bacterium]